MEGVLEVVARQKQEEAQGGEAQGEEEGLVEQQRLLGPVELEEQGLKTQTRQTRYTQVTQVKNIVITV